MTDIIHKDIDEILIVLIAQHSNDINSFKDKMPFNTMQNKRSKITSSSAGTPLMTTHPIH